MSLIRDEDINEVRERADIVEVISGHVTLKKAGRIYKGLCPFHNEKTPSFTVDPDKQLFHCFGCGEGGTVYTFIMKTEHLDFPEAVRFLAKKINFTLHEEEPTPKQKAVRTKQARLYELNERALKFFQSQLATSEGKKALAYLKKRGYGEETIEKFKIGYAPNTWDTLTNAAVRQRVQVSDLIDSGLSVRSDKGPLRAYDRFRGRVMFPILDMQERVVGFGGRVIGDEQPKYMNSPETPVFHKGKMLYALSWSRNEIAASGEAVIVEGYTDTIGLMQAGVGNVVATLGTALTPDHLRLLSRFAKRIVLVFDADQAGEKAVERGLALAGEFYLSPEAKPSLELMDQRHLDLFVVSLPAGQDPADFVGKEGGDAFKKKVAEAVPLMDFVVNAALASFDLKTVTGKARASDKAIDIISSVPSAVEHEYYLKKVAEALDISYESLFDDFNKALKTRRTSGGSTASSVTTQLDPAQKLEREVLKVCIQHPDVRGMFVKDLTIEHFTLDEHRRVYEMLKEENGKKVDVALMIDRLPDGTIREIVAGLATEPVRTDDVTLYAQEILRRIKEFEVKRRIHTLKGELKKINPERDPKKYDALFEQLLKLEAFRRELQ